MMKISELVGYRPHSGFHIEQPFDTSWNWYTLATSNVTNGLCENCDSEFLNGLLLPRLVSKGDRK